MVQSAEDRQRKNAADRLDVHPLLPCRRISGVMLGLPARRRDFQRQKQRKPARCQRRTVSG